MCKKAISSNSSLAKHKQIHTGEKLKNVISVKMIFLKMVVLLTIRVFIQVKSRKNVISVKMISLNDSFTNHKSICTGEKP